ncbi:MAG: protein-L-isoaspartate(D-aspartate) O-methyltransferase [Draconibacterium sp.]|nr:protein-L-isoaspartate(D-aspartate) O-methyltransferase [Draconibacterium sp.]
MNDTLRHKGMRKKLVGELKIKGIRNTQILEAINNVPRHLFMESTFINFAYKDQAFPIGAGQTISQPYTVAFQTQLLQLEKNDKVLEVGTGSGYQAAVLLEMGVTVFTIERQKELYVKVRKFLSEIGYNPAIFFGDGYKGLPNFAPFDKILVTAGATSVPNELKRQLKIGGRLVIPVGDSKRQEMNIIIRISENEFKSEKHGKFVFVPLLKGTVNI